MPTGTIVADNYIDDPNRTVSEVQTALNQQLDYLRSLKSEVDALSSTVIRESAVRAVGNVAGNVPDKAVIDARLATTGNLGSMATKAAANYLAKSEFNPATPTLVWSGSASSVAMSALSEQGPGFYIVNAGDSVFLGIYIVNVLGNLNHYGDVVLTDTFYWSVNLTTNLNFEVIRRVSDNPTNKASIPISQIYKV